MADRMSGLETLRHFLTAATVAFVLSFLAHLFVQGLQPGLSEAAEWLLLGCVFLASFAATRALTARRRSAADLHPPAPR